MSAPVQYSCGSAQRRELVLESGKLNGIDYLEIVSADQRTIAVHFLFPAPGQTGGVPATPVLTAANFAVQGGARIQGIVVKPPVATAAEVITLQVDQAGDFSVYTLRLVTSSTNEIAPAGFDPRLAFVEFTFKAACDSDYDCLPVETCSAPAQVSPVINYLAKDYASFRRVMLERLSLTLPQWQERNPADVGMVMVEMLAHVADQLSYYQDAVATEAYLGTARRRTSVRRHARLLNYQLHEGVNARAFIQLDVEKGTAADNGTLPTGTAVVTSAASDTASVTSIDTTSLLAGGAVIFETKHALKLSSANNRMAFYTWGDTDCCLRKGSTSATFRNYDGRPPLDLQPGDLISLEEVLSPLTGNPADADPNHRHVVRLKTVNIGTDPLDGKAAIDVEWFDSDALPFDLQLSTSIAAADGPARTIETALARGNVVLADHGVTASHQSLVPPAVPKTGNYRPRLPLPDLTFATPFDAQAAASAGAQDLLAQDPRAAIAALSLGDGSRQFTVRRDLLGSDRFATDFVVETERDGTAFLRFGDGVMGLLPAAGTIFDASFRVGNGLAGNVGAEALSLIVFASPGIANVRNPLPATGGTDPETLDDARLFAPQSFRVQQRAVTPSDYADAAMRHPEVQRATASFRWTGSWYTVLVAIDRAMGMPVDSDESFKTSIRTWLETFRMSGHDVEVTGPVFVPLDIQIGVCVADGYFQADVFAALRQALGTGTDADGQPAFFNPDRFTFGQSVYASQLYARILRIPGVAFVLISRFGRYGQTGGQDVKDSFNINNGVIKLEPLEVARLDNDPNFPENGRLVFEIAGGL